MLVSRDDTNLLPRKIPNASRSERQRAKAISDREHANNPNLLHLPDPKGAAGAIHPPPPGLVAPGPSWEHPGERQMLPLTRTVLGARVTQTMTLDVVCLPPPVFGLQTNCSFETLIFLCNSIKSDNTQHE